MYICKLYYTQPKKKVYYVLSFSFLKHRQINKKNLRSLITLTITLDNGIVDFAIAYERLTKFLLKRHMSKK